jgi:hypothetical protein
MRLDLVGAPQPLHPGLRDTHGLGHCAHTPALLARRRPRRPADDLALGRRRDPRLAAAALDIGQPDKPGLQTAVPPTATPPADRRSRGVPSPLGSDHRPGAG